MPLCLEAAKNRQIIPLDKAVLLFGRHPDCDVVLSQSAKISRKHCCIMHVNASCVLRDLGSTNGVHLNGQRVKKIALLKSGDQLVIGDVMFKVNAYIKPQAGNGAKPNGSQKNAAASNSVSAASPNDGARPPVAVDFPEISMPEMDQRAPRDLSQELPVAIPDEGDEFYGSRSDPAFREVADHGVPLLEDERVFEAVEDSQVDVILLDPHDADSDEE